MFMCSLSIIVLLQLVNTVMEMAMLYPLMIVLKAGTVLEGLSPTNPLPGSMSLTVATVLSTRSMRLEAFAQLVSVSLSLCPNIKATFETCIVRLGTSLKVWYCEF